MKRRIACLVKQCSLQFSGLVVGAEVERVGLPSENNPEELLNKLIEGIYNPIT
jgi:hypothetical protein